MLMHPSLEGWCAIVRDVTNHAIWYSRLFHTWTESTVWMMFLPVDNTLETGTVRACHGTNKLERVALLTKKSVVAIPSGFGHKSVCILYTTVAAATVGLSGRDKMLCSVLASCSLVPMIRRAVLWIESAQVILEWWCWHSSRRAMHTPSHCIPEPYRLSLYLGYLVFWRLSSVCVAAVLLWMKCWRCVLCRSTCCQLWRQESCKSRVICIEVEWDFTHIYHKDCRWKRRTEQSPSIDLRGTAASMEAVYDDWPDKTTLMDRSVR